MIPAPPPVQRDPLLLRVGSLCRAVDALEVTASVRLATWRFQDEDTTVIPVTRDGAFIGVVEERDLLYVMSGEWEAWESLERVLRRDAPTIHPAASGAEALRAFEATRSSYLVVVDNGGAVYGILTPSRLAVLPEARPRSRIIGGMATPFGVYLTNGKVGAGAGPLALAATGALLFGLFVAASYAVMGLTLILPREVVTAGWYGDASSVLALALFLAGMRALPLAGIHAAEHKVVHAIEQGEELDPVIVARMSRIHPRCGTNLAAGAMIFLGLFGWNWTPNTDLRLLLAFFATIILWRPVGFLLQQHATTKEPTPAQIEMGIQAGKALLARMDAAPGGPPTIFQRIASSGVLHIMLGSFALQAVALLLFTVFRVPEAWRPF